MGNKKWIIRIKFCLLKIKLEKIKKIQPRDLKKNSQ